MMLPFTESANAYWSEKGAYQEDEKEYSKFLVSKILSRHSEGIQDHNQHNIRDCVIRHLAYVNCEKNNSDDALVLDRFLNHYLMWKCPCRRVIGFGAPLVMCSYCYAMYHPECVFQYVSSRGASSIIYPSFLHRVDNNLQMILIPPERELDVRGYTIDQHNKEGPVVLAYLNNNNASVEERGKCHTFLRDEYNEFMYGKTDGKKSGWNPKQHGQMADSATIMENTDFVDETKNDCDPKKLRRMNDHAAIMANSDVVDRGIEALQMNNQAMFHNQGMNK